MIDSRIYLFNWTHCLKSERVIMFLFLSSKLMRSQSHSIVWCAYGASPHSLTTSDERIDLRLISTYRWIHWDLVSFKNKIIIFVVYHSIMNRPLLLGCLKWRSMSNHGICKRKSIKTLMFHIREMCNSRSSFESK